MLVHVHVHQVWLCDRLHRAVLVDVGGFMALEYVQLQWMLGVWWGWMNILGVFNMLWHNFEINKPMNWPTLSVL